VRRALPVVAVLAVLAVVVIGLSQAGGKDSAKPAAKRFDLPAALSSLGGAPAPLASLHKQANQLLDGGKPAFMARVRSLRGHPIVVNKWASWCGPCRHEFPFFQQVSTGRGKQVAFIGVDGKDGRAPASDFLKEFPLTYPSYEDPKESIARAVGAPANYPITVFLDAKGKQAFIRQGGYASEAQLQRDIDRYLLGKG
jgi:thiol-disulfide isomerase/thioredoxin